MVDYNKPDSAYNHLIEIIDKFPDKDFSERVIYALASYYETKGEKDKADSLYRHLYDNFTDTEISNIVARRLNLPPKFLKKDLPELEYWEAEKLIGQKKYIEAIDKLYQIFQKYEKTDYAPKSLLLIGHIYENELMQYDSAYSVYKYLKDKFPHSLFTQRINQKLIAYEIELQRKELELKMSLDSLDIQNQIPEQKPDENEIIENEKEEPIEIKIEEPIEPDSKIQDSKIQEKQQDKRRRR